MKLRNNVLWNIVYLLLEKSYSFLFGLTSVHSKTLILTFMKPPEDQSGYGSLTWLAIWVALTGFELSNTDTKRLGHAPVQLQAANIQIRFIRIIPIFCCYTMVHKPKMLIYHLKDNFSTTTTNNKQTTATIIARCHNKYFSLEAMLSKVQVIFTTITRLKANFNTRVLCW